MREPSPSRIFIVIASSVVVPTCFGAWAYTLAEYGVDVLLNDQWDSPARQINQYVAGDLTLGDLAAQHNEGRKVLPNLVSIGVTAVAGHYDVRAELFVGYALAIAVTALVGALAWRSFIGIAATAALVALFAGLFWSAHTAQFHLYSINFERLLPELSLFVVFLVFMRWGFTWLSVAVAILACAVAQYSFPGGIALWVLVPVFLMLAFPGALRLELVKIALITTTAAASTALYFYGYHRPGQTLPLAAVLDQPFENIQRFFFRFLGHGFTSDLDAAWLVGASLFAIFVTMFVIFLVKPPPAETQPAYAAWFTLGGYVVSQGVLVLVTRLPMDIGHAVRTEYIVYPIYLAVAAVAIGIMMAPERARTIASFCVVAVAAGFMTTLAPANFWDGLRLHRQHLTQAKACLTYSSFYADNDCIAVLYPGFGVLSRVERSEDFIQPRVLDRLPLPTSRKAVGYVDSLKVVDGRLRAHGWAAHKRRPADAVIALASALPTGKILKIARVSDRREDVAQRVARGLLLSGWSMDVPVDGSLQPCDVRFFAIDTDTGGLAALRLGREIECHDVSPADGR